jgi:hypothetical protein
MLAPTAKTQRVLETIQVLLTFASVCAVVEATRFHSESERGAGYYACVPEQTEASANRSIADLARAERKRREAELDDSIRGLTVRQVIPFGRLS